MDMTVPIWEPVTQLPTHRTDHWSSADAFISYGNHLWICQNCHQCVGRRSSCPIINPNNVRPRQMAETSGHFSFQRSISSEHHKGCSLSRWQSRRVGWLMTGAFVPMSWLLSHTVPRCDRIKRWLGSHTIGTREKSKVISRKDRREAGDITVLCLTNPVCHGRITFSVTVRCVQPLGSISTSLWDTAISLLVVVSFN